MTTLARALLVAAALLIAAPPALAQVVSTIKTPPLADSSSFIIPINIHIPAATPPFAGWAGAIVKAHILDGTEMDVLAVTSLPPFAQNVLGFGGPLSTPATGPNFLLSPGSPFISPFGPPSANITSVPLSANFFPPGTATGSGIPVLTSSSFTVATALIHAKNTFGNNSDIDASVLLWNIYHLFGGTTFSSIILTLFPSDRLWVQSLITDPGLLHTTGSFFAFPAPPAGGLGDPNGHWLHFTSTAMFHLGPGAGSQFIATLAEQTFLGIEHVPEPATGAMLAGGLLALAASRQARRRRLDA